MASSTYEKIATITEEYLKTFGAKSRDNSRSSKSIVEFIREKINKNEIDIDATDGTILSYISIAANGDDKFKIESGGSRGGYWFNESKNAAIESKKIDTEIIEPEGKPQVTVSEKTLYPLMELWLEKKGYAAKDMSNLKGGGIWGNPDIIGANRVELFGAVQIELGSCEIKISEKNWEQVIFEAISHKIFSNRSWFCYRSSNEDDPLPKGIEYYAERYRVGIVQIILDDDELFNLNKMSKKESLSYIDNVIEKIPAPYDNVPLNEQRELISRAGITLTVTF